MPLNVRFDTNNDIEIIEEKIFPLGTNFINFLSLDMENILNDKLISTLSKSNYLKIISNINKVAKDIIIPEIIDIHVLMHMSSDNVNIQQLKKDLKEVLKVYNTFKELTEFCYFNKELKDTMPLQNYIYYLHKFEIEEVTLPQQTINSFGLKPKGKASKNNTLAMIQKNSPFLYFNYKCSNISDYMITTFLQLIQNNYLILKCKNCNKYFIPYKRTDTYYCDRPSPQDTTKSCKKYAIELTWREKVKDESDWHCLYRRVYQSFQMKAKRQPNNLQLKQNFDNFRADANEWKKAVKGGAKTEEEFMCWLQDFRKKK